VTWFLNGNRFNPDEDKLKDWVGFVYVITDLKNEKKYVGKKTFWSRTKLPPLKGKTRKRIKIKPSNWMDYYGSSEVVTKMLNEQGEKNFHREIIHLCTSKGEMSYMEAKEQFDRNVLLDDSYYNGIINCRINQTHVLKVKERWLANIRDNTKELSYVEILSIDSSDNSAIIM